MLAFRLTHNDMQERLRENACPNTTVDNLAAEGCVDRSAYCTLERNLPLQPPKRVALVTLAENCQSNFKGRIMDQVRSLREIASRVCGYQAPEVTLESPLLFLANVMARGSVRDVLVVRRYFDDADFELVLRNPPKGVFTTPTWYYWNLFYKRTPIPPPP
jgi:hypothetical protein